MLVDGNVISEIGRVLSALRASFDVNSYPADLVKGGFQEVRDLYLGFEEIRLLFRSQYKSVSRSKVYDRGPVEDMKNRLIELFDNRTRSSLASMVRFRPLNMSRPSGGFSIHPGLNENQISGYDAVQFLIAGIDSLPEQRELFPDDAQDLAEKIRRLVPRTQGVAPLKFRIENNKLSLLSQEGEIRDEDKSNALSAKSTLIEQGEKILENLRQSNCDRRLTETVSNLQEQLQSGDDIIALGLKNVACNLLAEKFSDELPEALSALLLAQTTSISMYVAQFEDWQRFTEKAAAARISDAEAPVVRDALSSIIDKIENDPSVAEPEVPRTLRALRAFLDDPAMTTKHAVYAVWRSLENLTIVAFNYGVDFIGQTATKTSNKVSGAASNIAVIALVSVALAGATPLVPLASKVPESAWLSKAVELIQDLIE